METPERRRRSHEAGGTNLARKQCGSRGRSTDRDRQSTRLRRPFLADRRRVALVVERPGWWRSPFTAAVVNRIDDDNISKPARLPIAPRFPMNWDILQREL